MKPGTTYLAVNKEDLREVVQELITPEIYLDLDGVHRFFSFSPTFVETLVREKQIRKYQAKGHPRKVTYKYSELEAVLTAPAK